MNTRTNDKDMLNPVERWLERFSVVLILLLLGFFMLHQFANTGFFTERFGTAEMLCLYVPIVVAMLPPLIRARMGRRHPARLWVAASSLLTAVTALWLLSTFPFNFAHFADFLPGSVRFMFFWLSDDLAKIPLVLQIIVGPISALVAVWQFLARGSQPSATLSSR